MNKQKLKIAKRSRRHGRVRSKISGNEKRPRLVVFRANQNIYAQLIDDETGKTLAAASTLKAKLKGNKTAQAGEIGTALAKKAQELKISEVVFDRGGFAYHGRGSCNGESEW